MTVISRLNPAFVPDDDKKPFLKVDTLHRPRICLLVWIPLNRNSAKEKSRLVSDEGKRLIRDTRGNCLRNSRASIVNSHYRRGRRSRQEAYF